MKNTARFSYFTAVILVFAAAALAADAVMPIRVTIDFSDHLRDWDGFGVNYVETAQTRDYKADPQDYGGFSTLPEESRQEILDLIFGAEGLRPALVKMFLDPFHEPENDNTDPNVIDMARFDHTATTQWMRYFVRGGLERTRARGGDLQIITTLYGPPAWATKQKFVRGRDLDPAMKEEVAEYMISWVKHLRETEKFPVRYIALHNEGEDWVRWPADGSTWDRLSHDYNMWWPPEQVVDFLRFMPGMLAKQGLQDVSVTPGETTNWHRFHMWGYARAIAKDPVAVKNLGLITSHGFSALGRNRWFADWRSAGTDEIREKRPGLHSWVTSTSWSQMDVYFLNEMANNIYSAKVNAIIPWAVVQRPTKWVGGDPNPGTAIRVSEDGQYSVQPGYYFYKQISRAGQPGMAVASIATLDTEIVPVAFARKNTKHPDSFLILNLSKQDKPLRILVSGSAVRQFATYRTSPVEQYANLGAHQVKDGAILYSAPPLSATTFFGE